MTFHCCRSTWLARFALVIAGITAPISLCSAQPAPKPQRQASAVTPDVFAQARAIGEADRLTWIAASDAVLQHTPTDLTAVTRKIAAHLASRRDADALVTYEAYVAAAEGRDRLELLQRIATQVLRTATTDTYPVARLEAQAALHRHGDRDASKVMARLAAATSPSSETVLAQRVLARAGDTHAIAALVQRASEGQGSARLMALQALAHVPDSLELTQSLRTALTLPDPMLVGEAARLAGEKGIRALEPDLLRVLNTGAPFPVPLQVACALAQLGNASQMPRLTHALQSDVPAVVLLAAECLPASHPHSASALVPLLDSSDPLIRIRAAARLGSGHEGADEVLAATLADANPVVREEALRVVVRDPAVPLARLKRLLLDPLAAIRILAADAILTRTPSS